MMMRTMDAVQVEQQHMFVYSVTAYRSWVFLSFERETRNGSSDVLYILSLPYIYHFLCNYLLPLSFMKEDQNHVGMSRSTVMYRTCADRRDVST